MQLSIRGISLAASFAAVISCSGDATAPRAGTRQGPRFDMTGVAMTVTTADIVVPPTGGYFQIGKHAVNFPTHSICALNSSYGVTEWDKPCRPEKNKVTFHVEVVSIKGREHISFSPEVRFVPTTKSDNYVRLYMFPGDSVTVNEDDLKIVWSPVMGMPGIDESASDSTLRTYYRADLGLVHRRVKHFSAFAVHDGDCEPTDPVCIPPVVP